MIQTQEYDLNVIIHLPQKYTKYFVVSDMRDRLDEFNELYDTNITWLSHFVRCKNMDEFAKFIAYILWSAFSGHFEYPYPIEEDKFLDFVFNSVKRIYR